MGVDVEERPVRLSEIFEAKEAFITSSIKGVLPVVMMDQQPIADGKVGTLSRELGAGFNALVGEYIMARAGRGMKHK